MSAPSAGEPEKPAFLQCCLVCNVPVPAGGGPPRSSDGSDLRQLLAAHVTPAARDELALVETVCAPCLASLQQWDGARSTARRLHQALAARYRAARQRRAACQLSLHLERLVVQIPYGAFLVKARGLTGQPWPELARRVAGVILESAGIARPTPAAPPPPASTRTVGCQTPADPELKPEPEREPAAASVSVGTEPEPAAVSADTEPELAAQTRPVVARRPRGRPPRSARKPSQPADLPPPAQQRPPSPRPLLGCLRGWEGITNVQPSAPPRPPAGAQKRVGFEDLLEATAPGRDLEETLSILSVADTASLLDRAETLSAFSDTADLSTLADENWTALELAGAPDPADGGTRTDAADRQTESTPSVSFAEPSTGSHRTSHPTMDKGEDLLREFAETMSNISEGVVLEDLEGFFEDIDRPCAGGGRPSSAAAEPPPPPAPATVRSSPAAGPSAVQCPVCHKTFRHRRSLVPHLRLHEGALFRCQQCDASFLHYYKLQLHQRRRHGGTLRRPDRLACSDCGRRFSHLTTLRQHERLHRGRGYPCQHCGKAFPSSSELSRHADSHRAEKVYKCDDCGRAFQVSSSLARHRTLHTDRAHHCDVCGKSFDRKDTMLKHRDTHKKNNEHACHLCGKMYKQRRILAKHIKLLHGGPGEHVCKICQKRFRTDYELVSHTRRVHGKPARPAEVQKGAPPELARVTGQADPV